MSFSSGQDGNNKSKKILKLPISLIKQTDIIKEFDVHIDDYPYYGRPMPKGFRLSRVISQKNNKFAYVVGGEDEVNISNVLRSSISSSDGVTLSAVKIYQNKYGTLKTEYAAILEEFEKVGQLNTQKLGMLAGQIVSTLDKEPDFIYSLNTEQEVVKKHDKYINRALNLSITSASISMSLMMSRTKVYQMAMAGLVLDIGYLLRTRDEHIDDDLSSSPELFQLENDGAMPSWLYHKFMSITKYLTGIRDIDILRGVMDHYQSRYINSSRMILPENLDQSTEKIMLAADFIEDIRENNITSKNYNDTIIKLVTTNESLVLEIVKRTAHKLWGLYSPQSVVMMQDGHLGFLYKYNPQDLAAPNVIILKRSSDKKKLLPSKLVKAGDHYFGRISAPVTGFDSYVNTEEVTSPYNQKLKTKRKVYDIRGATRYS